MAETDSARAGAWTISVVVPAHNQERYLADCLAALLRASDDDVEIIVVDDASTDATAAIAARHPVQLVRLRHNAGAAATRNAGAARARGEILVFIDADVRVRPDTLARIRARFAAEPEVAALFGSYDAEPAAAGVVSRYRNLLHHFVHQHGNREASTFWAGCGAVRRAAFEAVGGFDGRLREVEDIELGYRLRRAGYRIRLEREVEVKHLKRWTLPTMVRTDLWLRAVPWSRLLLLKGGFIDDINLARDQRLAVGLTGFGCAAFALAPLLPQLALLACLAWLGALAVNAPLFAFLRRRYGLPFTVACAPLHLLYYVISGLGFAIAWLEVVVGLRLGRRSPLYDAVGVY